MTQRENKPAEQKTPSFRVSRRNFLQAAGVGAAGAALAGPASIGAVPYRDSRAAAQGSWDQEADIVVVGSGAAALTAAVMAAELGNEVIVLEKAETIGGTTAKSGGGYWIPNNPGMQKMGIEDPREDALKYMVKYSYPRFYNPDAPGYGAFPNDFALIEAMYDNGSNAIQELAELEALQSDVWIGWTGDPAVDYQPLYPENKAPRGRLMNPVTPDGEGLGSGVELVRQLSEGAEARGVQALTGHRVEQVVLNDDGAVVGVEVTIGAVQNATPDAASPAANSSTTIRARKAVIFGTGGFTHNPWMVLHYQRGPMYGGCAVITNEGDFVNVAGGVGAKLGNMTGAYHAEIVFEQAMDYASVPSDVFTVPGDSMLFVNRYGKRVVNEKSNYNDRTQVHFNWNPSPGEWTNELLFMVYDQRTADRWAGSYPIPAAGVEAPYVITGESLPALGENIDARLAEYGDQTSVRLDSSFVSTFQEAVNRFNVYAADGTDSDFHRGQSPYDIEWASGPPTGEEFQNEEWPSPDSPNMTMYPLQTEGPFYAIILAAGTLTTNGGPVINPQAQVLNTSDAPIPGLYGAGSCIAAPSASAYWGGGATLGQAITTGYIAGINAAEEPEKEV